MPNKGIFNKNEKSKNTTIEQFEKQVLRINTLEVQLKELMRFEKQVRLSLLEAAKEEESKKFGTTSNGKSESHPTESEFRQELKLYNQKLSELKKRMSKLEQQMGNIETAINDSQFHDIHKEEWVRNLVERFLSEKIKAQTQREEKMHEKIDKIERDISIQLNREANEFNSNPNERMTNQPVNENTTSVFSFDLTNEEELEMKDAEPPYSPKNQVQNPTENSDKLIEERIEKLIEKYKRICECGQETEDGIIPESQQSNLANKSLEDKQEEAKDVIVQQEPILKTIYIENFNLDKYEQHNNFAQLGIKELSGTLNIGATYGIDAIPKKVIDSVEEDIETIKANKEKMKANENMNNPFHTDNNESTDCPRGEKVFGDVTQEVMEENKNLENQSIEGMKTAFSPEEDDFTEIDIEDVEHHPTTENSSEGQPNSPIEDDLYTDIHIENDPSDGENFS